MAADIEEFHKHWRHVDTIARNVERVADLLDEAPAYVLSHRDAIAEGCPRCGTARAGRAGLIAAGLYSILPEEVHVDG